MKLFSEKCRGFTLVEALIATGVSSMVLAGLMFGAVALMRSFSASEDYSTASSDQIRILDYISRDVRRALSMSVSSSPTTLTLTVPDQYTSAAPSRTFCVPVVSKTSIKYGTTPPTIKFYLSGTSFVREESGVQKVIATDVSDFVPAFDASDPKGKTVLTTVTFSPIYRMSASTVSRAGTTISSRAVMRN